MGLESYSTASITKVYQAKLVKSDLLFCVYVRTRARACERLKSPPFF